MDSELDAARIRRKIAQGLLHSPPTESWGSTRHSEGRRALKRPPQRCWNNLCSVSSMRFALTWQTKLQIVPTLLAPRPRSDANNRAVARSRQSREHSQTRARGARNNGAEPRPGRRERRRAPIWPPSRAAPPPAGSPTRIGAAILSRRDASPDIRGDAHNYT